MTRGLALLAVAACSSGTPGPGTAGPEMKGGGFTPTPGPEMKGGGFTPTPGIDVDRAIGHVAALTAIGPRPGDSPASARAIAYLEAQVPDLERVPTGDVELPAIEVLGQHVRDAGRIHTLDPDLVVRFGPPGRALLVMAHYDTVPSSPGAVDDAASVALLIELARVLRDHPPAQPIMLAFTANEEIGLVGAEALARQRGDEVTLAIALDLVGGSGRLSLNGASKLIGDAELGWLAHAADRAGVVVSAPLPHRVVSRWWPQAERADHGAFTRRGIRAFHFYNRGQDGEWIDRAYHSSHDALARVDRTSVDEAGRLLRALAEAPPPPHHGDGFWVPVLANVVIPRWPLVAFEILLALVAGFGLVRMRITNHDRPGGAGILAAITCLAVATACTIAVEHYLAPEPWLLAPLSALVAESLVLAGSFGLATRLIARIRPWTGERRYLAIAITMPLVLGITLLGAGAAELAWLWLVPAALLAIAPRIGMLATLLPIVLVLAPDQVREAAWNGFLPTKVPLAAWVTALGIPTLAAAGWWARARVPTGPLRTLVLSVGCGLAVIAGTLWLATRTPTCTGPEFIRFHLACEVAPSWPRLLH